jgi:hypothetical protein
LGTAQKTPWQKKEQFFFKNLNTAVCKTPETGFSWNISDFRKMVHCACPMACLPDSGRLILAFNLQKMNIYLNLAEGMSHEILKSIMISIITLLPYEYIQARHNSGTSPDP